MKREEEWKGGRKKQKTKIKETVEVKEQPGCEGEESQGRIRNLKEKGNRKKKWETNGTGEK